MLFAGDQDFICNYMGIEALIANMEWSGEKGLGVSVLRLSDIMVDISTLYHRRSRPKYGRSTDHRLGHGLSLEGSAM